MPAEMNGELDGPEGKKEKKYPAEINREFDTAEETRKAPSEENGEINNRTEKGKMKVS